MKKLISLLLLLPLFCFASVDVAFVELRGSDGRLLQLERNGQFAHVAIAYQGQWLHSHPLYGVEVISDESLAQMGAMTVVTVPYRDAVAPAEVEKFLGKAYDRVFSWSDDRIYSSELVAKLLNIEPQPMTFETEFWPPRFQALAGELGISPDDIFLVLKQRGCGE